MISREGARLRSKVNTSIGNRYSSISINIINSLSGFRFSNPFNHGAGWLDNEKKVVFRYCMGNVLVLGRGAFLYI